MRGMWIQALIYIVAALGNVNPVHAQATEFGKDEYVRSCAACHGVTGKGDGRAAKSLVKPPTDLTKLSEAIKGVFPISRVYAAIDGRIEVVAHGTRDMPVWGETYTRELKYPGSMLSKEMTESMARAASPRLGLPEPAATAKTPKRMDYADRAD